MSHPFNSVRQGKVEHSRVGKITKGYATGGPTDYNDPTPRLRTDQDKPSEVRHPRAHFAAGGAVTERARGGRTNKGATVNVIVAPSGQGAPVAGVGAPPMMAPPRPPMMPPGAGAIPPGGPPLPPGGPIRSAGGRTGYAKGGAVPGPAWAEGVRNGTQPANSPGKNDTKDIGRKRVITYKTGGAVEHPAKGGMGPKFTGGAGGGIARIEKEERAERKAGKPT